MPQKNGYDLLPNSLQGGYLSPKTWWRGAKKIYNSVATFSIVAVAAGTTVTTTILGAWINEVRNRFHDAYTEGHAEGTQAALAGTPYKLSRGTEEDANSFEDKLKQPCLKYTSGDSSAPSQGINPLLVGGAFGFLLAGSTTALTIYGLAFAAGRNKKLSTRLYLLASAAALAGLEVSWSAIALLATGDASDLGNCLGYNNGYVTNCGTTTSYDPPNDGNTVCNVPAENGKYITTKTYGGNVARSQATFFSDFKIVLPATALASLILIFTAFRNGQQAAAEKAEIKVLETTMYTVPTTA